MKALKHIDMKISHILVTFTLLFIVACSGQNSNESYEHDRGSDTHEHSQDDQSDHSHEHGDDAHTHDHSTPHEQEEFTINGDSVEVIDSTHHVHEDGSVHSNH